MVCKCMKFYLITQTFVNFILNIRIEQIFRLIFSLIQFVFNKKIVFLHFKNFIENECYENKPR